MPTRHFELERGASMDSFGLAKIIAKLPIDFLWPMAKFQHRSLFTKSSERLNSFKWVFRKFRSHFNAIPQQPPSHRSHLSLHNGLNVSRTLIKKDFTDHVGSTRQTAT